MTLEGQLRPSLREKNEEKEGDDPEKEGVWRSYGMFERRSPRVTLKRDKKKLYVA